LLLFNFVFDLHDAKIYTMDDITKELIYLVENVPKHK
jgi:hypothetical protein